MSEVLAEMRFVFNDVCQLHNYIVESRTEESSQHWLGGAEEYRYIDMNTDIVLLLQLWCCNLHTKLCRPVIKPPC